MVRQMVFQLLKDLFFAVRLLSKDLVKWHVVNVFLLWRDPAGMSLETSDLRKTHSCSVYISDTCQ